MKSLLTGYQLFSGDARASAPRAFTGPEGSWCWAVRGGPGWPVMALVVPAGGRARGRVLGNAWGLPGALAERGRRV